MDRPLLDLSDPAVKRMIKLAKRRGYWAPTLAADEVRR
jgi:hypothetical protein